MADAALPMFVQLIATVAGSSIVAALVSHHANVTRQDREFKLKKLEQLWRDVDRHGNTMLIQMTTSYAELRRKMTGEAEMERLHLEEVATAYTEINLVVKVYFPVLLPLLESCRAIEAKNIHNFMSHHRGEIPITDVIDEGGRISAEWMDAQERFTEAIAAVAKDVRDESTLSPITRGLRRLWAKWSAWLHDWETW